MKIDLQELCDSPVLAGTLSGKAALNKLLERAAVEPPEKELILIDLSEVEVATASFLRESVLTFRDIIRGRRSNYYPIVANANDVVRDELLELLRPRGDVLMCCTLADDGSAEDAMILGDLDPKQNLTFHLVIEHGETDASSLMREYGESEGMTHTTAWNNRLAALSARGLIVEQNYGRAKRYRPIF